MNQPYLETETSWNYLMSQLLYMGYEIRFKEEVPQSNVFNARIYNKEGIEIFEHSVGFGEVRGIAPQIINRLIYNQLELINKEMT